MSEMSERNIELGQEAENSAPLLTFNDTLKFSVKLLKKRDFSVHDMRQALMRAGHDENCISEVIEHLLHLRYLDDERLAANLLKKYTSRGKGPHYIEIEFAKRGLVFSMDAYRKFFDDQEISSTDQIMGAIERAGRKYLRQNQSWYDFERKVLFYLFRQGLIREASEISLYKSSLRQLWNSKQIDGSN